MGGARLGVARPHSIHTSSLAHPSPNTSNKPFTPAMRPWTWNRGMTSRDTSLSVNSYVCKGTKRKGGKRGRQLVLGMAPAGMRAVPTPPPTRHPTCVHAPSTSLLLHVPRPNAWPPVSRCGCFRGWPAGWPASGARPWDGKWCPRCGGTGRRRPAAAGRPGPGRRGPRAGRPRSPWSPAPAWARHLAARGTGQGGDWRQCTASQRAGGPGCHRIAPKPTPVKINIEPCSLDSRTHTCAHNRHTHTHTHINESPPSSFSFAYTLPHTRKVQLDGDHRRSPRFLGSRVPRGSHDQEFGAGILHVERKLILQS